MTFTTWRRLIAILSPDVPATSAITGLVTSTDQVLALTLKYSVGINNSFTVQGANVQRWA